MRKQIKHLLSLTLVLIMITVPVTSFAANTGSNIPDYLEYPEQAVTVFTDELLTRVSTGADYQSNKGYSDTCLYISPYWKLKINGINIPVYATLNYDEDCGGVLQSYQYLFPDAAELPLSIELIYNGNIENAVCLPEKENIKVSTGNSSISAVIDHTGTFTFLINSSSQDSAVTVFVRQNRDEEAEIASYIEQYGVDNVRIFEKGCYEFDKLPFDKAVTYFKRGSYIKANHITDVTCPEDENTACEFMPFEGPDGSVITGLGTIDFNSLDWHERTHCILRWKKNIRMEGLIFLNPSSWTLATYGCEDCSISDITVFGYRTNSDGINICGSSNIKISGSFCRNGDDCFSVKTTNDVYEAKNIIYTDCIGWSNKARCFGITGEVYRKISDIEFTDCSVIYRNATWNNDRVCSLSVMVEAGGEDIENVTFKNIEIYHDSGRPVLVLIAEDEMDNCTISGLSFINVTCNGSEKLKFSTQRDITAAGKFAACINKLLEKSGLLKFKIFASFSSMLSRIYNSKNIINFSADNVTVNGAELKASKHCIMQGNVFHKIN